MTHSTHRDLGRKATSLSFIAFERSIKAELGPPGNRSKLWVWTQMPTGRTIQLPINIEGFEGMGTLLDQRRRQ